MAFWEQVKRGMNKAATEAEKQANIARLALELSGVRNDVKHKTEQLGAAALQLQRSGEISHPSLEGVIGDIAALETRVGDLERQIEELRTGAASAEKE